MDKQHAFSDFLPFSETLTSAKQGSEEDLDRLLASCRNYLSSRAICIVPTWLLVRTTHEDVVQETMLNAWSQIGQFDGEFLGQFRCWLATILGGVIARLARDYRRRTNEDIPREQPLDDPEGQQVVAPNSSSPVWALEQRERSAALGAALVRLPEKSRQVVELRYIQCQTFKEIGCLLQLTVEGARTLNRRALMELAEYLQAPTDGEN